MINSLKSFYTKALRKEQGAIIVLTAVLLPVLLGFMGLSYDVGNLYIHKTRLQNIADAAALAGAREYIDSQKKTTGVKDKVNGSLNEGYVVTYREGNEPDARDGMHPNADNGADYFIYKNAVNLHNAIQSDEYSHLALASTVNDDNRVFYRIGLNEQVPLHFMPILLGNVNGQAVSAESIAVIEVGKKAAQLANPSIFNNLYTYSGTFDPGLSNSRYQKNHHEIYATFKGDIVFTYGDGAGADGDSFYNMDIIISNGALQHLFQEQTNTTPIGSQQNHDTSHGNNFNNSHWEAINDPTIDTIGKTTGYDEAFREWLKHPHIEITDNNKNNLTSSDLNNPNSSLYLGSVTVDGNPVRVHNNSFYYITTGNNNEFLAFDGASNSYAYLPNSQKTEEDKIRYVRYGNNYLKSVKRGDRYYLLDRSGSVSSSFLQNGNLTGQMYDGIDQNTFDTNNDQFFKQKMETNIIHFNNHCYLNISFDQPIGNVFSSDNASKPIYIIVENTVHLQNLNFSKAGRPVILVYYGTEAIQLQTGDFNGAIYAPYASEVYVNLSGTYQGNIITKNIRIQASGHAGSWIQKNYLEGENGYTDQYVYAVTKAIEESINVSERPPTNVIQEIRNEYINALNTLDYYQGSNALTWEKFMKRRTPYSSLDFYEKKKLYETWQLLRERYPQYADFLWPWNDNFDPAEGGEGGGSSSTPDKLRLIDPRTEYTDSNPFASLK